MSLQPLVENAVQHGLDAEDGGLVRITCRREGPRYLIAIENSAGAEPGGKSHGTGIGQRNVRERLRLVYGDDAALVCEPIPGGYRSLISLPMETA
jgi:LytS/YehU family sensor histidine kinase